MKKQQIILLSIFIVFIVSAVVFYMSSPLPATWLFKYRHSNITYAEEKSDENILKNITIKEDINYGSNKLDYLTKKNHKSDTLLVYVHSGDFVAGNKKDTRSFLVNVANLGISVASINYDLAPKKVYPFQINQIAEAYKYLEKTYNFPNVYFMADTTSAHMLSQFVIAQANVLYSNKTNIRQVINKEMLKGVILNYPYLNLNNKKHYNDKIMWAYFGEEQYEHLVEFEYTDINKYIDTNFPNTFIIEHNKNKKETNKLVRLLNSKDVYNEVHYYDHNTNFQYNINKQSMKVLDNINKFINKNKN